MKKCKYRQNSFEVEVSYEVVRVWHYREHRGAKSAPEPLEGLKVLAGQRVQRKYLKNHLLKCKFRRYKCIVFSFVGELQWLCGHDRNDNYK